jgi:hypothetical protein
VTIYAAAATAAGCPPPAAGAAAALATLVAGVVWLCRRGHVVRRKGWQAGRVAGAELRRLREILYDLLPTSVAEEMVRVRERVCVCARGYVCACVRACVCVRWEWELGGRERLYDLLPT